MTTTEIRDALIAARAAANLHANSEDGGTCNFDCVVLRLTAAGGVVEVAKEIGLRTFIGNWSQMGRYVWLHFGHGQGNRNTRMAEAAFKSLTAAGLPVTMYYQMD